jgi:hypothetical protein
MAFSSPLNLLRLPLPQDAALLLSVAQDEAPYAPGLTAAAARKRLCRIRSRSFYLPFGARRSR